MKSALYLASVVIVMITIGLAVGLGPSAREPAEPVQAQVPPPAAPAPHLEREGLPPSVRGLLRRRMVRHGQTMTELVTACLYLDYPRIAGLSDQVAAGPRIARPPIDGEPDLLNRYLPPRFFRQEDRLRADAASLAARARAGDDRGVARAYGRLAATCIHCHAVYLRAPARR